MFFSVFSLADSFIREIAENQPDINITSADQLCICTAALIHDLGILKIF